MTIPKPIRIAAPWLLAALLITSCAGDGETVADPTTTTSVAEQTTTTTSDMADMDGADEGHDHSEGMVTEWEGPPPQLEIVIEDGSDGRMIALNATGFEFADPDTTEKAPGLGHTHVFVDGRLLTMSYERAVPLPDLDPGPHEIEITLAAVDHSDYVIDGEIVSVATTIEIEGDVEAADVTIEVTYAAGEVVLADPRPSVPLGSTVELVLTSDVNEELHLHGYDITVDVAAGETQRVRFVADIPGVFEVELEQSGLPVLDLTVS